MEDKEKRRNFVNNIEFIPYIQLDSSQKIMISDFVKDYDELQQELSIANDKLKKIKTKINDYSCIYNKGFPYTLLLALRGNHPTKNQYLELDTVLNDFEKIIKGDEDK